MASFPDTGPAPAAPASQDNAAEHWRRKRRLTLLLLAVWFACTFFVMFFARELDNLKLFGWPLSFYMAAQGVALIYLAMILIYNRRMRTLEAAFRREEKDSNDAG
jgi:putative solute:sodium symporter small subunit